MNGRNVVVGVGDSGVDVKSTYFYDPNNAVKKAAIVRISIVVLRVNKAVNIIVPSKFRNLLLILSEIYKNLIKIE